MKNVSITLAGVLFLCGISFAQLNPSFETWSGSSPDINPDNWSSNNAFTGALGVDGLFVIQDTDASEGSYSAKLITKNCPNCPANGYPDPITGFMDQVESFAGDICDSILFDYKYIPAASTDTGYFQIRFNHWEAATQETVRDYRADYVITASSTWKTASSPIIPDVNNGIPDTLEIEFFSSLGALEGLGTDTDGTELLVDNVRFVCITGVEESLKDVLSIQVFPNPAVNYIVFETNHKEVQKVDFLDISGKIVQRESLSVGQTRIELTDQPAGNYIYIIYAEDGRQMKSGKILVEHK